MFLICPAFLTRVSGSENCANASYALDPFLAIFFCGSAVVAKLGINVNPMFAQPHENYFGHTKRAFVSIQG